MKYRECLAHLYVRLEAFLGRAVRWNKGRPCDRILMSLSRWVRFNTRLKPLRDVPYRVLESCLCLIDPDCWFRMNRCVVVARRPSVPRSRIRASRRAPRDTWGSSTLLGARAVTPTLASARRRMLRMNSLRV